MGNKISRTRSFEISMSLDKAETFLEDIAVIQRMAITIKSDVKKSVEGLTERKKLGTKGQSAIDLEAIRRMYKFVQYYDKNNKLVQQGCMNDVWAGAKYKFNLFSIPKRLNNDWN